MVISCWVNRQGDITRGLDFLAIVVYVSERYDAKGRGQKKKKVLLIPPRPMFSREGTSCSIASTKTGGLVLALTPWSFSLRSTDPQRLPKGGDERREDCCNCCDRYEERRGEFRRSSGSQSIPSLGNPRRPIPQMNRHHAAWGCLSPHPLQGQEEGPCPLSPTF